jgi:hypothetical protein
MTLSPVRTYVYLTAAFVGWALLGSLVYGVQWASSQEGRWVEWILGGQMRWLPWVFYGYLIIRMASRLEGGKWDLSGRMLAHLGLSVGVILAHAAYLRFMRPIPPMLLYGRSYSEVLARFQFSDYLSYQNVFMDLAVYLVIAIPVTLLLRQSVRLRAQPDGEVFESESRHFDRLESPSPTEVTDNQPIEHLLVRLIDKSIVLPVREIEWVEAADYYVQIHTCGERVLHRQSIQKLEQLLPREQFIRVHRRAMVNVQLIAEIVLVAESKWAVRMKSGALVEVSRRRRQAVEQRLENYST